MQINHITNITGARRLQGYEVQNKQQFKHNQFFCYKKLNCFAAQLLTLFGTHFPAVSICRNML
jgi:hypothetical protein